MARVMYGRTLHFCGCEHPFSYCMRALILSRSGHVISPCPYVRPLSLGFSPVFPSSQSECSASPSLLSALGRKIEETPVFFMIDISSSNSSSWPDIVPQVGHVKPEWHSYTGPAVCIRLTTPRFYDRKCSMNSCIKFATLNA